MFPTWLQESWLILVEVVIVLISMIITFKVAQRYLFDTRNYLKFKHDLVQLEGRIEHNAREIESIRSRQAANITVAPTNSTDRIHVEKLIVGQMTTLTDIINRVIEVEVIIKREHGTIAEFKSLKEAFGLLLDNLRTELKEIKKEYINLVAKEAASSPPQE
jgi:hypothetical protein